MLYLLLIIPHLLATAGLLWWAVRSSPDVTGDDLNGGSDGGLSGDPPRPRHPGPSRGGPPLDDAMPPRRRMRVGEQLPDLYPARPRREPEPARPGDPRPAAPVS